MSSSARRIAAEFLREQFETDGVSAGKLSNIFKEEPPPLDVFLYDKKYLNHLRPTRPSLDESGYEFRLSEIQFDFIRNLEQVFKIDLYIAMVEEFGEYWSPLPMKNMFVGQHGKGSGKDTTVRLGFVRIASLLEHMVSPQGHFELASSDSIHMLNVAYNAQQARDAFFQPLKKLFMNNEHLMSMVRGDDPAEGANRIELKNNISIISGNSVADSMEGLNILAGVADEISAFRMKEDKDSGKVHRGAEEIVSMMRSSASSRFPDTYKVVQISYPRYYGDAIQKATAQGNKSIRELGYENSPWYVSGPYATWEVRPNVTKDHFKDHYNENPEQADAMYACKPPRTINTFIRDTSAIDNAFRNIREEEPIVVDYFWGLPSQRDIENAPEGREAVEGWQVKFSFAPDFKPVEGALYCLHSDMAIRGDRAGVAMSHVKSYRSDFEGEERPIIKNDFTFSFAADLTDSDRPREIQIRWYRQLIWELIERGFEITTATWDQFQSTEMRQSLQMYGIDAGLLSLDRNDRVYQMVKDVILDNRLEGYRLHEGEDTRVIHELKRLTKAGKKVDHLPTESKDESDALAGSVFNAAEVGGEEDGFDLMDSEDMHRGRQGVGHSGFVDEITSAMYSGIPYKNDSFGNTPNINPFENVRDEAGRFHLFGR